MLGVWDLHAWSLKGPNRETLSPRSPSCANGGGRLRDLPQHRQLQLHQLHHVHMLQAALCQVGAKGPRAIELCPETQVVGLILTMLLLFQLSAQEWDGLLHRSLGWPSRERAMPDTVLRALQPHVLPGDNLGTCRQLPALGLRAWKHQGLQGLAPKVEETLAETCVFCLLRSNDNGQLCAPCSQHP